MFGDYIIIPGCSDGNRGDQALIWETMRLCKDAGFVGNYYMLSDENVIQSQNEGITPLKLILPHPSAHDMKNYDNFRYGHWVKVRWGIASVIDLAKAMPICLINQFRLKDVLFSDEQKKTLEVFRRAKAIFVKGGGFLHSYSGTLIDTYKIFFFLYHINLALAMEIPVYILPNSFGPFEGNRVKSMIYSCLSKCKLITARESISREMLKNVGIFSKVFFDMAFHMQEDLEEKIGIKKILLNMGIPIGEKKCVAITVRPYRFTKVNGEAMYMKYKMAILYLFQWLISNNYFPCFVEHVYDRNVHESDIICIDDLRKMIPADMKYGVISDKNLDCRKMKLIYSQFDYTVGTRFHSVIFSISSGVPSIAITYGGNKGRGVMRDIGLEEFSIPIEDISGEKLIDMFKNLISNRANVQNRISNIMERARHDRNELVLLLSRYS